MNEVSYDPPKDYKKNFKKSREMLKNYFKALYENAGMEWTEQNDKDIEFIVNSILLEAVNGSTDVITKVLSK